MHVSQKRQVSYLSDRMKEFMQKNSTVAKDYWTRKIEAIE
jgi:hypothetical protein